MRGLFAILGAVAATASGGAAERGPVVVQSAPGRFEIAATDASHAHAVAAQAEEAWHFLSAPLGLPDAFSTPVFVRLLPAEESPDAVPFHVVVEPGGVVSLGLRVGGTPLSVVRRALVHALLIRLGVMRHGVTERLSVPLWLEHACAGWWETRANAAQLDALKYESARLRPPPLEAVLGWRRGPARRDFEVAAVWLLTFLQAESIRGREWTGFVQSVIGGDDPEDALTLNFAGRFENAEDRELWWRTGWHHVRRVRSLPGLEAAESHVQLDALARFVFAADTGEEDRVVRLAEVVARAAEPIVATEIARRLPELSRLIPALHPFYRNAGLSLAEVFRQANLRNAARREQLVATFEQDWRDAVEIAAATTATLDALEAAAAPTGP